MSLCQASLAFVFASLVLAGPGWAQPAADTPFDAERMAQARAALYQSHGGQLLSLVLGERVELQSREGDATAVWEAQGWLGTDRHKWWVKTEGERPTDDNAFEEFELQSLYSRALTAFWDLQAGIRHDLSPNPSRTYAVVGMQGLAPYLFEVDAALFLSDRGDLSARLEVEYELRLTQRLLLQPRLELNGAFS
ncbi:MAG: copper resistance protein B, partial [Pseudomonadota bacterium]